MGPTLVARHFVFHSLAFLLGVKLMLDIFGVLIYPGSWGSKDTTNILETPQT
jgi:hypothetical protein